MCVEVALDGHEGEDREGEATHAGQPLLRRQKRRPEVIHEHEGHGDDMKCRRTQVEMSGLVQMGSPYTRFRYKIPKPSGIATNVFLSFFVHHPVHVPHC